MNEDRATRERRKSYERAKAKYSPAKYSPRVTVAVEDRLTEQAKRMEREIERMALSMRTWTTATANTQDSITKTLEQLAKLGRRRREAEARDEARELEEGIIYVKKSLGYIE